jgi:2-methylcitrate dehydratase
VGDLNRITAIEIRTSHEGYFSAGMDPQKWAPETSETADHSLPYVTAKAMFDGDISLASYHAEALHDPKIRAFMQKIKVVDDPELTRLYPKYYATVVTATRDDGQTFTKRVDDIPGFATRPMTRGDFEVKFRKNVAPFISKARVDDALATLWALERQSKVAEILRPLAVST